jgi:type I restriction enzyme S subunit
MSELADWSPIILGDLVDGYRGVSYQPSDLLDENTSDSLVLLRANNIQNGLLNFSDLQIVPKKIVKSVQCLNIGDIAVCMSNGSKRLVGKSGQLVVQNSFDCTIGAFCSVFKPKPGADKNFIKQLFASPVYQAHIDISLAGSAINNLKNSDIESIPLMVPSKPKQRKIGIVLKSIDQTIEKIESLIEKYQQIKAGLMHDLFTRGITADGKLRPPREQAPELYQKTPIGWIPKDWDAKKLKDILNESSGYLQTGPFGSQLHAHEYTPEGVPVVMPQDINEGLIDTDDIARISEARATTLHKHRLKIGDVIIARRGELSRSAAVIEKDKSSVCGTGCFLLRLAGSNLNARFFSNIYRYDIIQRQVVGLAVGSTMPSLNNEIMGKLIFPDMIVDEQNRISDRLLLVEDKVDGLVLNVSKLQKEKLGLMHDLLTGKVQVNVDKPEASYAT